MLVLALCLFFTAASTIREYLVLSIQFAVSSVSIISDITIFVLKRDVKLQLTNFSFQTSLIEPEVGIPKVLNSGCSLQFCCNIGIKKGNLVQGVYIVLSSSSIIWYQSRGSDVLRLGRQL